MNQSIYFFLSTIASLIVLSSGARAQFVKTTWQRSGQYCVAYNAKTKLYEQSPVFASYVATLGRTLKFENSTLTAENWFFDCEKMNTISYTGQFKPYSVGVNSYAYSELDFKIASKDICASGKDLEKLPIKITFRFVPRSWGKNIIGRVHYSNFPDFRQRLAGYAGGVVESGKATAKDFGPCFSNNTFIEFNYERTNEPIPELDTNRLKGY